MSKDYFFKLKDFLHRIFPFALCTSWDKFSRGCGRENIISSITSVHTRGIINTPELFTLLSKLGNIEALAVYSLAWSKT